MPTRRKGQMAASMRKSLNAESASLEKRFQTAEALLGGSSVELEPSPDIPKVIRDTFTMPPGDYALLEKLRLRGLQLNRAITKSELVRLGLRVLDAIPDSDFENLITRLEKIKPGRRKS